MVTEESIPELLARLEREHFSRYMGPVGGYLAGAHCMECDQVWPCETARVVAHAKNLEAALKNIERSRVGLQAILERDGSDKELSDYWMNLTFRLQKIARVALGEAQ